jgi:hypothetical protein
VGVSCTAFTVDDGADVLISRFITLPHVGNNVPGGHAIPILTKLGDFSGYSARKCFQKSD